MSKEDQDRILNHEVNLPSVAEPVTVRQIERTYQAQTLSPTWRIPNYDPTASRDIKYNMRERYAYG